MDSTFTEIMHLPIAERLALVERIWDSIAASEEPLIIRDWHREEASRRAAELDADPTIAISREELWKRVDNGR